MYSVIDSFKASFALIVMSIVFGVLFRITTNTDAILTARVKGSDLVTATEPVLDSHKEESNDDSLTTEFGFEIDPAVIAMFFLFCLAW